MAQAPATRRARSTGGLLARHGDLLLLIALAIVAAAVDWQIAGVWSWAVGWRALWFGLTAVAVGVCVLRPSWRDIATALVVTSLYAVPVVGGILRWHLVPSGTAVIGDGALQTQLAGAFFLRGVNPYGADYAAAGLGQAPWDEPFASPALHHLVTWPGQFLLPLPLQAGSTALLGWWDERWFLLLAAVAVWVLLRLLLPGVPGRVAAIAVFLFPAHSLLAVLGDNDLPMLACLLGALLAAERRHFLAMGVLLGIGVATKQHAALALPLVIGWALVRGASPAMLLRAGAACVASLAALVLPFLVWDPHAFFADTVVFLVGGGQQAYPINGFGLSAMLLSAGVIHGARAAFPFAALELGAALAVWTVGLVWLRRHRQLSDVVTLAGVAFLLVLFVSRYFHDTHLLLGAELILAGLVARHRLATG